MLYSILIVTELLLSAALIVFILIQHGKGADAGAAFGSGASGTVFGAKGAGNFLSRTTAILATLFFVNCLALAFIVSHNASGKNSTGSVIETTLDVPTVLEQAPAIPEQPVVPAATAPKPADVPN